MRKILLTLAFCGCWGASQAMAGPASICDAVTGNQVTNCGFETGDFTGWTLGGNTSNPAMNYYGVDSFDANSGNFGAYLSQDYLDAGTAALTLSQTVATTLGQEYNFTFYLEQDTAPTTGYTHSLSATWGGATVLSLTPTMGSPGTVASFVEYSFVEAATSSSTTIQFTIENDDEYWSFDDVSVAQTPEPSTGLLGGMALGALLLLSVRRQRLA